MDAKTSKQTIKKNKVKTEKQPKKKLKRKCSTESGDELEQKPKKVKLTASQPSTSKQDDLKPFWEDYELLVGIQSINDGVARRLIHLFDEDNTIPFIVRYRKDQTGDLTAEQLREIKDEYDRIKLLKAKIKTTINTIEKQGQLNEKIRCLILGVQSMEELEHIYAPYKPGAKRTLAERAKALGLEEPALNLLEGTRPVNLAYYVNSSNKELATIDEVEKGIMHIIASVIATDTEVLALLRKLRTESYFMIEVKKSSVKKVGKTQNDNTGKKNVDESKFINYFEYNASSKFIKPHQVLAINRGESLKILTVKINIPDFIYNKYFHFACSKWIYNKGRYDLIRKKILESAAGDSFKRLLQPHIVREVRSTLKSMAERASYEVFSTNLKQLLLMPPVKGKCILGIDPGFSNGCQLAIISETGALLTNADIYLSSNQKAQDILTTMLKTYNCSLIALGNGTACRETEAWLSELIQNNTFSPLDVVYTIVNENGASIYSCSTEAKKEFPDLDPKIVSAVSLARRLQEPLAELVKVEPKHIGVGMYQHDLPKKQLDQALDEVVIECVSFVGVDLNTASQCLLKRIAGLSDKRAASIIQFREKIGTFKSRTQLKDIKGIGNKIFEQCAGFLRVEPATSSEAEEFYKDPDTTKLDCTYIHPESYKTAQQIIKHFNLKLKSIGHAEFIESVKLKSQNLDLEKFSSSLNSTVETVKLIIRALSQPLNFDLRSESVSKPFLRKD